MSPHQHVLEASTYRLHPRRLVAGKEPSLRDVERYSGRTPCPAPILPRYSGGRAMQPLGGGFYVDPRSFGKNKPHILFADDRTAYDTS